jgi:hypothetical protein
VAVGSGVGEELAVGSALGSPLGLAVGVLFACATWDGLGLCPGVASVFATMATRIAEVATTPTIPTVAFRLNGVAPLSSWVASVRQDWVPIRTAARRRIPEDRLEGEKPGHGGPSTSAIG